MKSAVVRVGLNLRFTNEIDSTYRKIKVIAIRGNTECLHWTYENDYYHLFFTVLRFKNRSVSNKEF